ncbi:CRP-like cAMP-binding protein [Chitinophaga skermanii]|uniref:CRP-like cAMP-binding protein n=1 Tax=Chitinophaga skermanii TaxID=331697 RepID=A0A327QYR2_9BACT|nr:Crp/Fnr family transcriptional regulator [Chitinophaga skermanii]RAJ08563.1 CRP-like cAMP-binding protein [Chitinophaga skermanii]
MTTQLLNYFNSLSALSPAAATNLLALFQPAKLEKGDFFAREGRYEQHIAFLLNGVTRAYFVSRDGTEYNKIFSTQHQFIGAYTAILTRQPSQINIQALTNCELLVANYYEIEQLFDQHQEIERGVRKLAESFFMQKEKREIELVLLDAQDRYRVFQEEYPGLENLIPQYQVAAYLGISPTQLSRIRAKR